MEDRRGDPRVQAPRVLVRITTPERMRAVYLKDLAEGAVFIRTSRPVAMDQRIGVDLLPPGWGDPLRLTGAVVRIQNDEASVANKTAGIALKFVDLDPESDAKLKALVQEYLAGAHATPDVPMEPSFDATVLVEQIEKLRTQLQAKEKELLEERMRRLESVEALAKLTAEHEHSSGQGAVPPRPPPPPGPSEELQDELRIAQEAVQALREELAAAQASATAAREELNMMEQDDISTRQLAEALAREKTFLQAEVDGARSALDSAQNELAEIREKFSSLESATGAHSHELTVRLAETEQQWTNDRAQRDELAALLDEERRNHEQARVELAQAQADFAALYDQSSRATTELQETKRTLGDLKTRLASLEVQAKEADARAERARHRERDVRRLLQAVSAQAAASLPKVDDPAPTSAPDKAATTTAREEPDHAHSAASSTGAPVRSDQQPQPGQAAGASVPDEFAVEEYDLPAPVAAVDSEEAEIVDEVEETT